MKNIFMIEYARIVPGKSHVAARLNSLNAALLLSFISFLKPARSRITTILYHLPDISYLEKLTLRNFTISSPVSILLFAASSINS